MTDNITISRRLATVCLKALEHYGTHGDREEMERAMASPPATSKADTVTISRKCAEYALRVMKEHRDWPSLGGLGDEMKTALAASSPSSSAMREAATTLLDAMSDWEAGEPWQAVRKARDELRAALSADDGWVMVEDSADIPLLRTGDVIRTDGHEIEIKDVRGPFYFTRLGLVSEITAYRRAQKIDVGNLPYQDALADALASPPSADDGWVMVNEEHPLPTDLMPHDWVRSASGVDAQLSSIATRGGLGYFERDNWEDIVAYRRAQTKE